MGQFQNGSGKLAPLQMPEVQLGGLPLSDVANGALSPLAMPPRLIGVVRHGWWQELHGRPTDLSTELVRRGCAGDLHIAWSRDSVLEHRSAVSRRIPLGPAPNVELRVETFNLLNHFNWANPGPPLGGGGNANTANFDAGNFGQITTQAGTPRIFQFGIKYMF
jgi:hypothetical protein